MNRVERFWAKVDRKADDECWLWMGAATPLGYGQFRMEHGVGYAYRYSYELARGPIPKGLVIDHLCRTPRCVNPAHLEAVTQRLNVLRGTSPASRQAQQTHCKRGHALSGSNLMWTEGGRKRRCRECARLHEVARRTGVHIDRLKCEAMEREEGWA